jgi:hypothetical protein
MYKQKCRGGDGSNPKRWGLLIYSSVYDDVPHYALRSTSSELKGQSQRRKCPVPYAFLSLCLATSKPNARERTRTFTILDDCTGIIIANVSGMTLHMHHELLLAGWCTGNLPHRACASQLLTRGLGRRQVARGTALVRSEHAEVAVR